MRSYSSPVSVAQPLDVGAPRLAGLGVQLLQLFGIRCDGRQLRLLPLVGIPRCYPARRSRTPAGCQTCAPSGFRHAGPGADAPVTQARCTTSGPGRITVEMELLDGADRHRRVHGRRHRDQRPQRRRLRADRDRRGAGRRRRAARPLELAGAHERAAAPRDPALHRDHPGDGRRRAVARVGAAAARRAAARAGDGGPQRAV